MNKNFKRVQEDDEIRNLIKGAARDLTDHSFDDRVMMKIQEELDYKEQVNQQLRTSFQYFLGATLTSIVLSTVFALGFYSESVKVTIIGTMVLFFFISILIINVGNYQRLIQKYGSKS
ncbi:MAG: hypothetical protein R8G66_11970 [Cytophagales bacterium]|nr:hypothetical protein [Cytophagales bacterium]